MGFQLPLWFEVSSLVILSLILIADLALVVWRPHHPSVKESL
ncbi:MAG: TerC family protein, partial [Microbacteriaceae bacterium]|nr:TerC family protein [Microbacteriaceae bacterium]